MDKTEEKLYLSLKKLYGRKQEVQLLHSVYDKVISAQQQLQEDHQTDLKENNDKESAEASDDIFDNDDDNNDDSNEGVQLVLIGGQSGTGKSDLVWNTFANNEKPVSTGSNTKKKDCIFGYGKFQKRRDSKPLSVISNLMSDIIHSLHSRPNYQEYKNKICAELGNEEAVVIAKLVPVVVECADMDTSGVDFKLDTKESLDQLKSAFRHFLRIISGVDKSTTCVPVVMCIDDIQWSCHSTLDLFSSLLTDAELQHVLIIGCYRDDELDTNSGGGKWIQTITECDTFKNNQNRITRMKLGNIKLLDIKQLLSDVMKLDIDHDETSKLAELIENRTCGNPFHVLQLIDYLQAEGLIKRDTLNYRWTWDYDTIQQQTVLSDNVVTIVTAKMKRLPSELQNCLGLASCMGFRFCPQVLNLLVKHKVIDSENVDKCIQIAVDEGLVESSNDGRLRFVHDKVYESAYQMIASEEARVKIHFDIGAALLHYYFNDYTNINFETLEYRILKDERTLFLCVDQLKLGKQLIIENSNNTGNIVDNSSSDNIDDFRLKAIKLHLRAAKMSMSYSAFLPAVSYLQEGLYLLQRGEIDTHDNDDDTNSTGMATSTTSTVSEASTGYDTTGDDNPAVSLIEVAENFMDIVDVKDRIYRFHSYKNCFVGSEAVDVMISNSMTESRDEAVKLGRQLCEEYDLFSHVTGDHEFKDGHFFYQFNSITTTSHTSASTAPDVDDHGIYCELYVELNTKLAEMFVITGQAELAIKIVDKIMSLTSIPSEAKLPIYLMKCRILSNQSKHSEVVKKSLYILNYLEGRNYSYVEEPGKVRYKLEIQRIKWNLKKLSDKDILSLPLIQDDNKEHKRIMYIMQFIELSIFDAIQCRLHKLATLLSCRFVQLSLDHGIAPLSPMGFAMLANDYVGIEDRHASTSKFQKFHNRSFEKKNRTNGNDSDRKILDIADRLSNLAIALTKKQSETNIVSKGMAGVYVFSCLVKHLRQPLALVVDDLIKGYEFGMKIGDIPNSFRSITAYFMFYFYSGLPLIPLLPDLKRFMQQMMDYSSYTSVRLNTPMYQCVLNLTGRNNMLNPVEFRLGTAIEVRTETYTADGTIGAHEDDRSQDGKEAEWSYLMQIAFYCGEMEIAWEMYEKLQTVGQVRLFGVTPFHQARVFFFALIEMWYAKSSGKHKHNKDAMKHVRVMRGWVNNQAMINCVHKLQILEAEVLSMDPHQNLEQLKKAYDTAIVSATRGGFLQDSAVANYLAGVHFGRVLFSDNSKQNGSNREQTSSGSTSAQFSTLSDLGSFRASSSLTPTKTQSSLSSMSTIDPDNYLLQAREMYDTWGATSIIKSLESNFPTTFSRSDNDAVPTSKRKTTGYRSRERFRESVQTTHSKLPDHLRASGHHSATGQT